MVNENSEVHRVPHALGLVAVFLAGVTVATTVALLATRSQGDRVGRKTDSVLDVCDRAMKTLELRVQAPA